MKLSQVVTDELTFKARISKMGNNKIIWIPMALHEMIKDFEKGDVMVSMKKVSKKK
jgi:antitoxin component of MazEF toxin-antitoxin module